MAQNYGLREEEPMHFFCSCVLAVLVLTPVDEILIGLAIGAVARAARRRKP